MVSGLFAPWFFCPLTLDVLPPLNTDNSTLRFRQFMHDDENKQLCECLMLCLILKQKSLGLHMYFIIQNFSTLSHLRMFAIMSDAVYR